MIVQILAKEGRPVGSVNNMYKKKVARSLAFSSPVIRELKHATFLNHGRQPEVCCFPI